MAQTDSARRRFGWTLLVLLVGQLGCITLVIISASLAAGLWLDGNFHTRPLFTLTLLLAGIPVSILLMLLVGRKMLGKFAVDRPERGGVDVSGGNIGEK